MSAPGHGHGGRAVAGAMLAVGLLIFSIVTIGFHPSHDENNHPVIFARYADNDAWVAVHFGQFAGVLIALGGFLVLHRVLEQQGRDIVLLRLAFGVTIATAAVWAALQAVDGTALKEASEAWMSASGPEKAARFGDAELARWTEWGLQSYFRVLLGVTFVLFGIAAWRGGVVASWAGLAGITAGALYAAVGIAVGHTGLDKPGGPVIQLLMLTFIVGVIAGRTRTRGAVDDPTSTPRVAPKRVA